MKTKQRPLFYFVICILVLNSVPSTSAVPFKTNADITDAYYGDYDEMVGLVSDGLEDDVRVNISLSVFDPKPYVSIDVYVTVVMPSGIEFSYIFQFIVIKETHLYQTDLQFVLLDIATEPGWYDVYASAWGERDPWSVEDEFTFDPPGQTNTHPY